MGNVRAQQEFIEDRYFKERLKTRKTKNGISLSMNENEHRMYSLKGIQN
jgi:hypothetical protein